MRDKKGDVSHLLECIACSEPSDVGRFSQLVDEMLKSGEARRLLARRSRGPCAPVRADLDPRQGAQTLGAA